MDVSANHTPSENELFLQKIQQTIAALAAADKGKLGESASPEVLRCDYAQKTATFRFPFHPWMLNCNNVMHGGCVALIMDNSMGLLSCSSLDKDQTTPTVSMQLTFLNPILLSSHILVDARVNAVKSKIVYAAATMYAEEQPDIPLATAVGEYYRMHPFSATVQPQSPR